MSWNYRVMRETDPNGERVFAIHEVYYDDAGMVKIWSVDAVGPAGESFAELTHDFANYNSAFARPVIAIEADGLYEIGPMGNSKKPKRIWEAAQEPPER